MPPIRGKLINLLVLSQLVVFFKGPSRFMPFLIPYFSHNQVNTTKPPIRREADQSITLPPFLVLDRPGGPEFLLYKASPLDRGLGVDRSFQVELLLC